MELMNDAYHTLGVREDASSEELKRAYQQLARRHHPDRAKTSDASPSEASDELFRQVQVAWEQLRDPTARRRYDSERRNEDLLHAQQASHTIELDLGEMDYVEDAAGHGLWTHNCRCGDVFEVTESQLSAGIDAIACRSCSLVLCPLYQAAADSAEPEQMVEGELAVDRGVLDQSVG